ncbi:MAG: divergent polysaccharide deacetylase family protein [Deltaproteobacteria bacterium]|nr:divergent polysaccharide deacetylase family protein [Deltaproteobacteria bacterium]
MKNRSVPRGGRAHRVWRWAGLALLAFLAGLVSIAVIVLLPGGERKDEGGAGPFSEPSKGPNAPAPPQGPPAPSAPAPRLAIVVDDFGYNPTRDAEWLSVPEKITVAVIPFGPSSRQIAESAKARAFGVIIHAPMEPEGQAADRTEGFRFRRGMDAGEMEGLLSRMTANIPEATGVSNHMGSAFTSDPGAMDRFFPALKARGLFFLDSVTSSRSVAQEAAQRAGVPILRRDVFLDVEGADEEMRRQWAKAVALAAERGSAVLICHARPETLGLIKELLPGLQKAGVRAVTLDELVRGAQG